MKNTKIVNIYTCFLEEKEKKIFTLKTLLQRARRIFQNFKCPYNVHSKCKLPHNPYLIISETKHFPPKNI